MTAIYTSPLERARETAEPIAARHHLLAEILEELNELGFGHWQGRTFQDLDGDSEWRRFNTVRSMTCPPGGELMLAAQTRMVQAITRLRETHPNQTVALVSHADPLRSLIAYCLGMPIDLMSRLEISPASMTVLEFAGDYPLIQCLNYTGELPV